MKSKPKLYSLFDTVPVKSAESKSVAVISESDNTKWTSYFKNNPETYPECYMPIKIKLSDNSIIFGYRIAGGFIVEEPYKLSETVKLTNTIEWSYINNKQCKYVYSCPQEFPRCNNCPNYK